MGIVEGRPQHLAARQILVGGGNPSFGMHHRRVDRPCVPKAGQGGAVGAHQKDRLDQIASRLHDGQRGKLAVIERALAHHAVDAESELLDDLVEAQRRHAAVAAPAVGKQLVGVADGGFPALDGYIHRLMPRLDEFAWCAAGRRPRRVPPG